MPLSFTLVDPSLLYVVLAQAIFQCIQGLPEGGLRRIILTASGGAFRDWPVEKLKEVKAADAIKHPNWRCGALPERALDMLDGGDWALCGR